MRKASRRSSATSTGDGGRATAIGTPITHDHVVRNNLILNPDQIKHLREDAIRGIDIGDLVYRLCVMNVLLHGIGTPTAPPPISRDDALAAHPGHN